jgi:hypothetical protein
MSGYATVDRLWPGETVVCIAGGPSLTQDDVDACRGRARVIVVNDGYRMAPWADVLYACDFAWYRWHDGARTFNGLKYTLDARATRYPDVRLLKNTGTDGIETDPSGLRTGRNSGFQAINLALHFGATRILLLGYDMQRTGGKAHWFGDHPVGSPSPLAIFVPHFNWLAKHMPAGVQIVNCSRQSALTCFRRQTIEDALSVAVAA